MEVIAFALHVLNPAHPTWDGVAGVLAALPRRYKRCDVHIAMRGASSDYEDWVAVEVSSADRELELACAEWITKQVTRRGYAIVPKSL